MRVYRGRRIQTYSGGAWAETIPDAAPTVQTRTTAGAVVENLTSAYDAARHRWYFDTTDASYTDGTVYLAYWTVIIDGVTYDDTDLHAQPYVHRTAATGDTTPPAAPSIGAPTVTDTAATFPHTAPTDADYDTTTIYCIPASGSVVSASGTGGTIEVAGLAVATEYWYVAVAYDTSGNPSVPTTGVVGKFTTATSAVPDSPIVVKWWVSDEDDYHEFGPEYIDATVHGSHRIGSNLAPLGRGRMLRLRLECHHPVWPEIRGVIVRIQKHDPPGGIADRTRT